MGILTPKTNLPGDFTWKPKYIVKSSSKPAHLKSTNGLGVTKILRVGTKLQTTFTLDFESSYKTYREIDTFLAKTGYGFRPFTWYNPLDQKLYTVRLSDGISPEFITDNTDDQVVLAVSFTLVFEVQN